MTTCPNCGRDITANDKFCSNCGTPLSGQVNDTSSGATVVEDSFSEKIDVANGETIVEETGDVRATANGGTSGQPEETNRGAGESSSTAGGTARSGYPMPPPVEFVPTSRPSVEEEWRMSSLGPPPKRRRSIWLYILIGILALCILSCVGFVAFSLTDTGREWIENMATEAAVQSTEVAD